jgi:hypothetical protein
MRSYNDKILPIHKLFSLKTPFPGIGTERANYTALVSINRFAALESLVQAIKDKATIKESRRSAVEETFRDIVDLDERHVEEFVAEQFVAEIVESKPFQAFSLAVIFLQAAITGVRTDRNIVSFSVL